MADDMNDQVSGAAPESAEASSAGKTRRLVLKMAGVGSVLGAAGAAGAVGMASASSSNPGAATAAGQELATQYPTTGVASILGVVDAGAALAFFKQVFDATVLLAAKNPAGDIVHAEFLVNGTVLGVTNEDPNFGIVAPTAGATPNCEAVTVSDINAAVQRVADNGGTVLMETVDVGDFMLHACFRDPFGHNWHLFEVLRPFTAAELQAAIERDVANGAEHTY